MRVLLAVAACLLGPLLATAGGAEPASAPTFLDLDAPGGPEGAAALVLAVSTATAHPWLADDALLGQPVALALRQAAPATTRQAIAHALGGWWIHDDDGTIRVTRTPTVFLGPLRVRRYPSQVSHEADRALVPALLAPWLSGHAGLAADPRDGSWAATLDTAGHRQLIEVLTLLERPAVQVPDLIPDPAQPDPTATVGSLALPGTWPQVARDLADALHRSVAIARPEELPPPRFAHAPATLGDLPGAFVGVQGAWRHGVLCLGPTPPEDTQHPAAGRRLAVLPVGHLLVDAAGVDAGALARELQERTGPERWRLPGYALAPIPAAQAGTATAMLLVAADTPLIHRILAALTDLDARGYPAWHAEHP